MNNTNDSLVAAQAKLEAEISELQEKVKNNEDQLQVTIKRSLSNHNSIIKVVDVQKESEAAQKVADLEGEVKSLKEKNEVSDKWW